MAKTSMRRTSTATLLAITAALLVTGCSRPREGTATGATTTATPQTAVPELSSLDPSSWVNGAPTSLTEARGSVVLIEAWDRY